VIDCFLASGRTAVHHAAAAVSLAIAFHGQNWDELVSDNRDNRSAAFSSGLLQFYTDDITLMPAAAIWRAARRQSLLSCLLLFPYFMARKVLRLRHRANHGIPRVTELPAVPDEHIPAEIIHAFAPFTEACNQNRMEHVQYVRSPCIGNRTVFTSIWLDPTGTIYCNMTWIDTRLGNHQFTKTVFGCHSWLKSDVELHTAPMAPEDWIPEIIPPGHDFMKLPAEAERCVPASFHASYHTSPGTAPPVPFCGVFWFWIQRRGCVERRSVLYSDRRCRLPVRIEDFLTSSGLPPALFVSRRFENNPLALAGRRTEFA
jgi:hypothetical protein